MNQVLPTSEDFFTKHPLYKSIDITEISPSEIADFFSMNVRLIVYVFL